LADAADAGMSWAQVWDILAVTLEKVHYLLPRRRCGCGKTTTAAPPFGAAGTVSYGPNINAAAILLASQGNVPIERTAQLMEVLLGVSVSTGFVARALERFAQRLAAAGFDDAMKTALRAQNVLCADETPTNVVATDTDTHGKPVAGPRTRSPCALLMPGWCTTRRSAPGPRPPSRVWACSPATPATWSETTTPAGTSSTPS
jgi:pimeloyl-ACP methyl ester carboxylesterase